MDLSYFWPPFFSLCRTPFNNSCRVGLLKTNSLSLCRSETIIIFFIFEWYLFGYRILVDIVFSVSGLNMPSHCHLDSMVLIKKQWLILLRIFYVWWVTSFLLLSVLSFLVFAFDILIMMYLGVDLFWVFLLGVHWDSLICRFMPLIIFERLIIFRLSSSNILCAPY